MTPQTLLASVSTVVVGAGVAAGLTFALKPSSLDNSSAEGAIVAPQHLSYSNNYLVTSLKSNPSYSKYTTCKLDSSCQLFNWGGKEPINSEQLSKIQVGNSFLLNIDQSSLVPNSVIEVTGPTSNALWFTVQATTKKTSTGSLAPVAPAGLISRADLISEYKTSLTTNKLSAETIRSAAYYNSLEPTYIDKGPVKHQGFLVFEWGKENDKVSLFTDASENIKVDKYIFKSVEDQKSSAEDDPKLLVKITGLTPIDNKNSLVEIYEIKNQDPIKQAIEQVTKDPDNSYVVPWGAIGTDSMMVTKLSQLEKGKYYKFVIDNFSDIETQFQQSFKEFQLNLYIPGMTNQTILFKRDINDNPDYCIKLTSESSLECKYTPKKQANQQSN